MGMMKLCSCIFFFFNDTATTEIYTLSLHDALPIWNIASGQGCHPEHSEGSRRSNGSAKDHEILRLRAQNDTMFMSQHPALDRKSTRLNSSHANISYAVFCLKKKKK